MYLIPILNSANWFILHAPYVYLLASKMEYLNSVARICGREGGDRVRMELVTKSSSSASLLIQLK